MHLNVFPPKLSKPPHASHSPCGINNARVRVREEEPRVLLELVDEGYLVVFVKRHHLIGGLLEIEPHLAARPLEVVVKDLLLHPGELVLLVELIRVHAHEVRAAALCAHLPPNLPLHQLVEELVRHHRGGPPQLLGRGGAQLGLFLVAELLGVVQPHLVHQPQRLEVLESLFELRVRRVPKVGDGLVNDSDKVNVWLDGSDGIEQELLPIIHVVRHP
mmetsp:Transcript_474/g.1186  ORF Transcript_474/g.1186 Transcript_474/m.1186 type:complete len:217 (-) Transcript_474:143-793(-)